MTGAEPDPVATNVWRLVARGRPTPRPLSRPLRHEKSPTVAPGLRPGDPWLGERSLRSGMMLVLAPLAPNLGERGRGIGGAGG